MKRAFVFLAVLVGLSGALYLAGQIQAQGPAGAAPAPVPRSDKPRIAVFNVAKVMSDFDNWKYHAVYMNNKRIDASKELGKLRIEIADLQKRIEAEPLKDKQNEMVRTLVEKQRQFEDRERVIRMSHDEESANHLKTLFGQIQRGVAAIADSNGYDIIFAYPDVTKPEEKTTPLYFNLMMQPTAAMPFFVSRNVDVTEVLIDLLNRSFKAPGPVPQPLAAPTATGGTGAPGQGVQPATGGGSIPPR